MLTGPSPHDLHSSLPPPSDPLFGLGANVALIFSGQYVRWVSGLRAGLGPGADPWAVSLRYLMGAVVASGGVLVATYTWMLKNVIKDKPVKKSAPKKKKVKMTLRESANFLLNSPYIRNLATLVIGYGMCINLVEVSWKSKLKVCTRKSRPLARILREHGFVLTLIQ
jgi:ATP:ADP antiporter, AAA family